MSALVWPDLWSFHFDVWNKCHIFGDWQLKQEISEEVCVLFINISCFKSWKTKHLSFFLGHLVTVNPADFSILLRDQYKTVRGKFRFLKADLCEQGVGASFQVTLFRLSIFRIDIGSDQSVKVTISFLVYESWLN